MVTIAWGWLLAGAIVMFGTGVFIGAVVIACCSLAGCTDCRLAAAKAATYRCQLLMDGDTLDIMGCYAAIDGIGPGPWCAWEELPCIYCRDPT